MPRPEFQNQELLNCSKAHPLSRRLLHESVNQDEVYFTDYIPPARDAIIVIITSRYMLYILIGALVIIVGTYGITSHLLKDLLHDLADWLFSPNPEKDEEEEEEVVSSFGQEDRAGERKRKQEENQRATSGDENSPEIKLSL